MISSLLSISIVMLDKKERLQTLLFNKNKQKAFIRVHVSKLRFNLTQLPFHVYFN